MMITDARQLATVAEQLRDDEIHVWKLDYRRALGRAPLRRVLAAYLDIDPRDVLLTESAHGRPALDPAHAGGPDFNWSHSGEHALIAIAHGVSPGVDLERQRPRPKALEIAQRFFCTEETAALAAVPPAQRSAAFLDVWTAKEAVLKAHGRGLAFGLDRLSVAHDHARMCLRRFDGDDVGAWQLQHLVLGHSLVGALAWRGGARRIRLGALASGD